MGGPGRPGFQHEERTAHPVLRLKPRNRLARQADPGAVELADAALRAVSAAGACRLAPKVFVFKHRAPAAR